MKSLFFASGFIPLKGIILLKSRAAFEKIGS